MAWRGVAWWGACYPHVHTHRLVISAQGFCHGTATIDGRTGTDGRAEPGRAEPADLSKALLHAGETLNGQLIVRPPAR